MKSILFVLAAHCTQPAMAQDTTSFHLHRKATVRMKDPQGKLVAPVLTDFTQSLFQISWIDGAKRYTLSMGEAKWANDTLPTTSQVRFLTSPGSRPKETRRDQAVRIFDLDADLRVRETKYTNYLVVVATGEDEETEKDPAKKNPDFRFRTVKGVNGDKRVFVSQMGPAPRHKNGYTTVSQEEVIDYKPVAAPAIKYTGFHTNLKKHVDRFSKQHEQVVRSKGELEKCVADSAPARCESFQKKYASADAARDKLWSTLLAKADMKAPRRPSPQPPPNSCERCNYNSSCGPSYMCLHGCCEPRHGPGSPHCFNDSDCGPAGRCVDNKCE